MSKLIWKRYQVMLFQHNFRFYRFSSPALVYSYPGLSRRVLPVKYYFK